MIVYDVPKMVCYADADTFVNAVNPIRGTNGIRPLGARRYYHARWIAFTDKSKFPNEPKHTIDVGTYASDVCVRFYPNNRITFFAGRWPLNTRQLVGAMFKNRFKVRYASRHKWYLYDKTKHIQYPVTDDNPLTLKCVKTEQGLDYILEGKLVVEQKHYVVRDKYLPIIKQYKDFIKYIEVMNKLSGGSYSEEDVETYRKTYGGMNPELLRLVANKTMESAPDIFASAFNNLVGNNAKYRYYEDGYRCHTYDLKSAIYSWIKDKHKDIVYEMRDVPNTTIIR
jgi:hypothetical protein